MRLWGSVRQSGCSKPTPYGSTAAIVQTFSLRCGSGGELIATQSEDFVLRLWRTSYCACEGTLWGVGRFVAGITP